MNLEEKLVELITQGQKIGEFGKEQIPEIVNQLIRWKLFESISEFLAGILLLGLIYPLIRENKKHADKNGGWGLCPEVLLTLMIPVTALIIPGIDWTIEGYLSMLQLYFAPKVYLIEYVSRLIK